MPLSTGQVLNGRYRIDMLLGQGGMGSVYRAWDWNLNMQVAIKENLDASPRAYNQFSREAQILSRLHHPNLPRVTDYFFIPAQGQYLVMDFAEGEDLQTMVDRLGVIPEPQVLSWVIQVCGALSYLHNQTSPIIHRDIKPANIKVHPSGRVMLVDFGIAKFYDPRLVTLRGARAVTPGYSPPEQYGTGTTDARSDVYALGATMYHLLTGHIPPESVRRMVGGSVMLSPCEINPSISPVIEQALLKAVAIGTNDRFQSVDEFRAALTQAGYEAVALPPPPRATTTRPSPLWRRLSREILSPPAWGLAGIVGLALFLIVALVLFGVLANIRHSLSPTPASTLLPVALDIPTETPVPATPTQRPQTPTASLTPLPPITMLPEPTETPVVPTPELTPSSTPTPTPVPVRPEPMAPPWGLGPYRNPIAFRWRGSLSAGQAYQVTVYNIEYGYLIALSPLLTTQSWVADLPDERWASGEYRWKVAVVRQGKELIASPDRTFWFSPNGGPQPPTPTP